MKQNHISPALHTRYYTLSYIHSKTIPSTFPAAYTSYLTVLSHDTVPSDSTYPTPKPEKHMQRIGDTDLAGVGSYLLNSSLAANPFQEESWN